MTFNGSKADLLRSLKLIPYVLAGQHPDPLGLHALFWGHVANGVLNSAYLDFFAKMQGATGLDGVKWLPLAAATIAKRQRAGRTDDLILMETIRLAGSLRPGQDDTPSGADGQVWQFRPDGIEVGSEVPYADAHQNGVPGRLPARPFVPADIPAGWEVFVEQAMEEGLVKVIEAVVAAGGIP